jgi:hypothetical protein
VREQKRRGEILLHTLLFVTNFLSFIILSGVSSLPNIACLCTLVLAMPVIRLLHAIFDGGPSKWTYEDTASL